MARVPGEHRPTTRLRHVFDKQSGPTRDLVRLDGQSLQQGNHIGMRPVAIARQPHDLPSLAIDRKRLCAGKTALVIETD